MAYVVVGLGNPGEEYEGTRHNTGRIIAERLDYKTLDEFMNNSGPAVAKAMAGKKVSKLIIIHDDLDLPLGTFKISFGKGPGGHKGVASIIRALKTKAFIRIRVGIAGKRKPKTETAVLDFILAKFKPKEFDILKKLSKKIAEAVSLIAAGNLSAAQNRFN